MICEERHGGGGRGRGERALSLIEILLAVVVLSLSSLPVLHFILSSKRGIMISHQELLGTNLASNLVKRLKALPYDQIPLSRDETFTVQKRWGPATFRLGPEGGGEEGAPAFTFARIAPCPPGFQRWLAIVERSLEPGGGGEARIKLIKVRVTWKKAGRAEGKVEVCTCVASPL